MPAAIAGLPVVLPALKYQRYWRAKWFWFTMVGLSLVQVPLVVLARPLMERFRFGFNILFATLDLLFVIVVVNCVRSRVDSDK